MERINYSQQKWHIMSTQGIVQIKWNISQGNVGELKATVLIQGQVKLYIRILDNQFNLFSDFTSIKFVLNAHPRFSTFHEIID